MTTYAASEQPAGRFTSESLDFNIESCVVASVDAKRDYGFDEREMFNTEKKSFKAGTPIVFVVPVLVTSIKKDLPAVLTVLWMRPAGSGEILRYEITLRQAASPENYMAKTGLFLEDSLGNRRGVAPFSLRARPSFVNTPGIHTVAGVELEVDGSKFAIKPRCETTYTVTK